MSLYIGTIKSHFIDFGITQLSCKRSTFLCQAAHFYIFSNTKFVGESRAGGEGSKEVHCFPSIYVIVVDECLEIFTAIDDMEISEVDQKLQNGLMETPVKKFKLDGEQKKLNITYTKKCIQCKYNVFFIQIFDLFTFPKL